MSATILDGKAMAQAIEAELIDTISWENIIPCLAIMSFGDNAANTTYVQNKIKACNRIGIRCHTCNLRENDVDQGMQILQSWAKDPAIHGIIIQLPAPHAEELMKLIPPYKDVDGLRPDSRFTPCTALAIMKLLPDDLAGKHAVVVGRSKIVGRPVAKLLLDADATVTVCHSHTQDLAEITQQADILVCAVGKPNTITYSMVKPGATVIDVGINRVNGRLVGDVDYPMVEAVAGAITPVPGGVGPMTVSMLMQNVVRAAMIQN